MSETVAPPASLRLDKWLWHARFCKTRALAQKLIENGLVTLNGAVIAKPSIVVRAGDKLNVLLGSVKRTVVVLAVAERRGAASDARLLYDESGPPQSMSRDERGLPLYRLRRR